MSLGASESAFATPRLLEGSRTIRSALFGVDVQPISSRHFFSECATTQVKEFTFSQLRCREHKVRSTHPPIRQDYIVPPSEVLVASVLIGGNSRLMQDGREIELGPGDFRFCDTSRPFVVTIDDEFEGLYFGIPRHLWVGKVGPTEQITAKPIRANTFVGGLAFDFFRQVIPTIGKVEAAMADRLVELLLALVNTLAASFSQDATRSSGHISLLCRAKTLIEENLEDPGLNPEKIAQSLRISERYLRDLFHEEGTTVCNWMWDRRVEKCRQKLSDPLLASKSIGEIALGCGFSDFTHFGRRFKAAFSMSPSQFRRERLAIKP